MNPLERAAAIAKAKTPNAKTGWTALGDACGVSYTSIRRWSNNGHLPWPCLLGWQDYHKRIAIAVDHEVTADELLDWSRKAWKAKYAGEAA